MAKFNKQDRILFLLDSLKVIGGAEQMYIDQANYFYQQGLDVFFALSYSWPRKNDFSSELKLGHPVAYFRFKSILDIVNYFK